MGKRIGYVDAMRGLAMLLVVIGHVFYFSFCDKTNVIYRILSDELQIPLFFMVSGFLVSVPGRGFWSFVGKKAFLLCVPAAIFMAAYVWKDGGDYVSAWVDSGKCGYWFTFSLFWFILLYSLMKLFVRYAKLGEAIENIIMISIALILLVGASWCMRIEKSYEILELLGLSQFRHFFFFIIGVILAKRGYVAVNKLNIREIRIGG